MDDSLFTSECDHPNVIIHIDIDCFYAQVEMVRNPVLKDKPVGIKQKNFMVTCNYVARSLGVKKSMRIEDALKMLPDLVLVDGSDLTPYRHYSAEIFSILQTYTKSVEKLGMDENFIDVTDILDDYDYTSTTVEGCIFSYNEDIDVNFGDCFCGCYKRLVKGSFIAKKIRDRIHKELGITTCAGVAHNKLLAKLVCGHKKPNNQTVVFPSQVESLMQSLTCPRDIPGIGPATYKILESLGIKTMQDLQLCTVDTLNKKFDQAFSSRLRNLAIGIDDSKVKPSGPPQTLSIEDGFKKMSNFSEAKYKLEILIERLLILLQEDGRFPKCLRLTVRKCNKGRFDRQREIKHAELHSSLFGNLETVTITSKTKEELNKIALNLFNKLVNTTELFHLTLLGVGFTKFFERATNTKSISQFFSKRLSQDRLLTNGKKVKPFVKDFEHKEVLEDLNNSNNDSVDVATTINSSADHQSLSCTEPYDEDVFNSLPEDIKRELQETPGLKFTQMGSLRGKNVSKIKSKNFEQNLFIKQKKIDSFFIIESKCENARMHKTENASIQTTANDASTSSNEAKRNKSRQQLVNKGIDLDIFEELPPDIKEDILAQL